MSNAIRKFRGPKITIDYKRELARQRRAWRWRVRFYWLRAAGGWVLFWVLCLLFVAAVAGAVLYLGGVPPGP